MHRQPLLNALQIYRAAHPDEDNTVVRIEELITTHEDCLLRTCVPGHITASVWIVDASHQRFLLTHHRKLQRWLQLGGHVDGEPRVERAALREAREESGINHFEFAALDDLGPRIVDLDVHRIPAHGSEPEHHHHDVRFTLVAQRDELRISAESLDLRWFKRHELEGLSVDESILRLARKSFMLLDNLS